MFTEIDNIRDFHKLLRTNSAVLAFFHSDNCNVCQILKPKIEELIVGNFPQIRGVSINLNNARELAADYTVFSSPSVLMFFNNSELFRKVRGFGIHELEQEIARPYYLLFS